MRSRVSLFTTILVVGLFVVPHFAHASIPFFGPIIPKGDNVCPAGWGMMMTVINNIIELLLTLAIVFVAPFMIAYSGFLLVVNQGNSSKLSEAKGVLTNTVVGIIIALAAWMIVDAIMAVLYNGPPGTWASLITSNGNYCLPQKGANPNDPLNPSVTTPGVTVGVTMSTSLSTSPGDPCNPATIMAAAPSISQSQANMLACVARGESTCGANGGPYNLNSSWNKDTGNGKASTAAGAYQVLLSSNSSCYDNPICEAAAGTPGTPLNCKSGFGPNGFTAGGNPTVLANCQKAAGNVPCSAAAAACLMKTQSFSSAYATDPYTASCQSQYGG